MCHFQLLCFCLLDFFWVGGRSDTAFCSFVLLFSCVHADDLDVCSVPGASCAWCLSCSIAEYGRHLGFLKLRFLGWWRGCEQGCCPTVIHLCSLDGGGCFSGQHLTGPTQLAGVPWWLMGTDLDWTGLYFKQFDNAHLMVARPCAGLGGSYYILHLADIYRRFKRDIIYIVFKHRRHSTHFK